MRISVAKESYTSEGRVAAAPSAVRSLTTRGAAVLVEQGAGSASGWPDDSYIRAGAEICPTPEELYGRADLVWKVMPPSPHEARLVREDCRVYCLGHALPPDRAGAVSRRVALDAHPAVRAAMGSIAGRIAVHAASHALQRQNGGRGLLLGGVVGVEPAEVVVIGAGDAGRAAVAASLGVGASVRVLDVDLAQLQALHQSLPGARTLVATPAAIERALAVADVVIACVRDASGVAPRVASRDHLSLMARGAVVVDLSITDGGAFESTPITDLDSPFHDVEGVVFVGVPNFAGAVPRTSSVALSAAALPMIEAALD